MTWTNLQLDILEDYADPRWYGMHLNQFELPNGVEPTTDTLVTRLVNRRTPDDVRDSVLEIASTKCIWFARDIAEQLGDTSRACTTQVGKILKKAGWRLLAGGKTESRNRWLNEARVWAWLSDRTEVDVATAESQIGVSRRTLAKLLRSRGWAPLRRWRNDNGVWRAGESPNGR